MMQSWQYGEREDCAGLWWWLWRGGNVRWTIRIQCDSSQCNFNISGRDCWFIGKDMEKGSPNRALADSLLFRSPPFVSQILQHSRGKSSKTIITGWWKEHCSTASQFHVGSALEVFSLARALIGKGWFHKSKLCAFGNLNLRWCCGTK